MKKNIIFKIKLIGLVFLLVKGIGFLLPTISLSQSNGEFKTTKAGQSNHLSILEESDRKKTLQALKYSFGISEPETMEPLKGGFAQKLYKFSSKNKDYVLRLSGANLEDLKRETKYMLAASEFGISPKVYYAEPQDGTFIIKYIKNEKLTTKEEPDSEIYAQLATFVKKIHQLDIPNPSIHAKDYYKMLIKEINEHTPTSKTAIEKIEQIRNILKDYDLKTPCHNDLNPNNLLFEKNKLWVIDWETALIGNPYFDLATVSIFLVHHKKSEDIYLETYFNEKPNAHQLAYYFIMKQVALVYYGTILINIAIQHKNFTLLSESEIQDLPSLREFIFDKNTELRNQKKLERDLGRFGTIMLKAAIHNMNSDQFKDAIKIVSNKPQSTYFQNYNE